LKRYIVLCTNWVLRTFLNWD